MNWFAQRRQEFIFETLGGKGSINRSDLMDRFQISDECAALDFRAFLKANPGRMKYDLRKKKYLRVDFNHFQQEKGS